MANNKSHSANYKVVTQTGRIARGTGFRQVSGVINRELIELKKQIKTPLYLYTKHNLEINRQITNLKY